MSRWLELNHNPGGILVFMPAIARKWRAIESLAASARITTAMPWLQAILAPFGGSYMSHVQLLDILANQEHYESLLWGTISSGIPA